MMTNPARSVAGFARSLLLAVGVALAAAPAGAEDLPLLTLRAGSAEPVVLDRQALDALPQHGFETTTQWTEGKLAFSGPALKDVLALVAAGSVPDEVIHLIAANNYEVILDHDLIEDDVPIIATRINGKPFGVRDKGPLWVVFPYDRGTDYQIESVFSASIWQLIEVWIER